MVLLPLSSSVFSEGECKKKLIKMLVFSSKYATLSTAETDWRTVLSMKIICFILVETKKDALANLPGKAISGDP